MKQTIRGTTLQVLDVELQEGESMYTESGGMAWMSSNIAMDTNTHGGVMKGIGCMFTGESLFMTTYTCKKGTGVVTFCSEFPGKILKFDMKDRTILCQRDAFMAAEQSVNLEITFTKRFGTGFFGGEGFFLQKLSGSGKAYVEISGEITEFNLKEGQVLKVDTTHIGAFEETVDYDIQRIKGVKNMLFGGEGIFLATLTGPGKVWLQSMPIASLAKKIIRYMPPKR